VRSPPHTGDHVCAQVCVFAGRYSCVHRHRHTHGHIRGGCCAQTTNGGIVCARSQRTSSHHHRTVCRETHSHTLCVPVCAHTHRTHTDTGTDTHIVALAVLAVGHTHTIHTGSCQHAEFAQEVCAHTHRILCVSVCAHTQTAPTCASTVGVCVDTHHHSVLCV
jgi:hypothetical protein